MPPPPQARALSPPPARADARPIDAPCTQCLRHGDPIHVRKRLTSCLERTSCCCSATASACRPTAVCRACSYRSTEAAATTSAICTYLHNIICCIYNILSCQGVNANLLGLNTGEAFVSVISPCGRGWQRRHSSSGKGLAPSAPDRSRVRCPAEMVSQQARVRRSRWPNRSLTACCRRRRRRRRLPRSPYCARAAAPIAPLP
eukprot:COSAG01_NODE_842_length_13174_cov_44.463250_9_plen_202_part_00